jgi:hypothetical protein
MGIKNYTNKMKNLRKICIFVQTIVKCTETTYITNSAKDSLSVGFISC